MSSVLFPEQPVLVVDDEPEMRKVVKMTLAMDGITNVVACAGGEEARSELTLRTFAAVILDLTMPGASGLDLLQRMREITPRPAVIVVSGMLDAETARFCRDAGAFDFLAKPVDRARLLGSVRRAIERWEEETGR